MLRPNQANKKKIELRSNLQFGRISKLSPSLSPTELKARVRPVYLAMILVAFIQTMLQITALVKIPGGLEDSCNGTIPNLSYIKYITIMNAVVVFCMDVVLLVGYVRMSFSKNLTVLYWHLWMNVVSVILCVGVAVQVSIERYNEQGSCDLMDEPSNSCPFQNPGRCTSELESFNISLPIQWVTVPLGMAI